MECPFIIFPHQISGCDYEALIKVFKWLLQKLKENRDNRGAITRRQGMLQYRLQSEGTGVKASTQTVDPAKIKQIIFNGKPKRVYKASQNSSISFQDPKRVHLALKEFNDLSANELFSKMIQQMQEIQNQEKGGINLQRRGTMAAKSGTENMAGSFGATGAGGAFGSSGIGIFSSASEATF